MTRVFRLFSISGRGTRDPVRFWVISLGLCATLSACSPYVMRPKVGPVSKMLPDLPDSCGLDGLADLQGQDFVKLADRALVGDLRVIWPGQEITSEISYTRVNVTVTNEGRITRLFCG